MNIAHPECLNFFNSAKKNNLTYLAIEGYTVNIYVFHKSAEDLGF